LILNSAKGRDARYLSDANRDRLERLRAAWDPDGLFCSYLAGNG
jgi:Berberine and berberine like